MFSELDFFFFLGEVRELNGVEWKGKGKEKEKEKGSSLKY